MSALRCGADKIASFGNAKKKESDDIHTKAQELQNVVSKKVLTIEGRQELLQQLGFLAPVFSMLLGGFGSGAAMLSVTNSTGLLVLSGVIISPISAIICAALIGGLSIGGLVVMIKRLWKQHNMRAVGLLQKISFSLTQLQVANTQFFDHIGLVATEASILESTSRVIELCLGSQRQRRINADICGHAFSATDAMIKCLKKIEDIDTSWLTDSVSAAIPAVTKAPAKRALVAP